MKILFPELSTNIIAKQSAKSFPDIEFIPTESLDQAASLLKSGAADSMISGLDYSSRDVLLAYKDRIPLSSDFFSSCFICQKGDQSPMAESTKLLLKSNYILLSKTPPKPTKHSPAINLKSPCFPTLPTVLAARIPI